MFYYSKKIQVNVYIGQMTVMFDQYWSFKRLLKKFVQRLSSQATKKYQRIHSMYDLVYSLEYIIKKEATTNVSMYVYIDMK